MRCHVCGEVRDKTDSPFCKECEENHALCDDCGEVMKIGGKLDIRIFYLCNECQPARKIEEDI